MNEARFSLPARLHPNQRRTFGHTRRPRARRADAVRSGFFLASAADAHRKGRGLMAQVADMIAGEQLELPVSLPAPDPVARYEFTLIWIFYEIWFHRRKPSRHLRSMQNIIELRERIVIHPDEIPEEGDYPVHLRVKASEAPPVKTRAPCSIFALGSEAAAKQILSEFTLARHAEPGFEPHQDTVHRLITREAGVVKHVRQRHDETDEWKEKERIRRAKQVLPKPPKQKFRIKKETA